MAAGPDAVLAAMKGLGEAPLADGGRPQPSLWRRLARWFLSEADDPRHVAQLSDHNLRDIGLTRAQAHDLIDRPRDPLS